MIGEPVLACADTTVKFPEAIQVGLLAPAADIFQLVGKDAVPDERRLAKFSLTGLVSGIEIWAFENAEKLKNDASKARDQMASRVLGGDNRYCGDILVGIGVWEGTDWNLDQNRHTA